MGFEIRYLADGARASSTTVGSRTAAGCLTAGVSLDVARELVTTGRRRLALSAHPDAGGSTNTMTTINVTADWLLDLINQIAQRAGARR